MGYVTRKDLEAAGVVIPDGSAPWSPPWLVPPPVSKPKASATGPTPEKPRELAAGQVWEMRFPGEAPQRMTLTRPDPEAPDLYWSFEEDPDDGVPFGALTSPEWRYLGTKEEVAAREAKAATPASVAPWEMPRPGSVTIGQNITAGIAAGLSRKAKPDPYPNAALHRAIDDAIAADSGPFAHARAAALRSRGESLPLGCVPPVDLGPIYALTVLRDYEAQRGGGRIPDDKARRFAESMIGAKTIAVYERERSRSPVHGRRGR